MTPGAECGQGPVDIRRVGVGSSLFTPKSDFCRRALVLPLQKSDFADPTLKSDGTSGGIGYEVGPDGT